MKAKQNFDPRPPPLPPQDERVIAKCTAGFSWIQKGLAENQLMNFITFPQNKNMSIFLACWQKKHWTKKHIFDFFLLIFETFSSLNFFRGDWGSKSKRLRNKLSKIGLKFQKKTKYQNLFPTDFLFYDLGPKCSTSYLSNLQSFFDSVKSYWSQIFQTFRSS